MRTKVLAVAVLILSCAAVAAPAGARVAGPAGALDIEAECSSLDTLAPERFETPVVGDWSSEVVLDVHVLAVEVEVEAAAEIMDQVAETYKPLGITVKYVIEPVELEPDPDYSGGLLGSDAPAWILASKEHFGGARPWWADVVYTMLGGEIASTVAGQADCVGGIAFDDAAFAVGEAEVVNEWTMKTAAKIAAHEIAHLLGAHHHFANCVEGDKTALVEDGTPCTLMMPDLFFVSLAFGTLEGAVAREYALEYANSTPTEAPAGSEEQPVPETVVRTVDLKITKGPIARGSVEDEGVSQSTCTAEVPVTLENKRSGRWRAQRNATTNEIGAFRFRLRKAGVYRVRADQIRTGDNVTCYEAVSPAVKAR